MPFIPNELDAFHASQASPDSGHLDALRDGSKATGVVSGCLVSAQGTPNDTVAVAAGVVAVAGAKANVAAGNLTCTADGTNPRFYIIVVSSAGVKSAVAGTPAPEMVPGVRGPAWPATPANSVLLASVYVPAADSTIAANQIGDHRVFVVPPESTTNYDLAKARSIPLVKERSQTVTLDTGQNLVHGSAMANGRLFLTTRTSPAWFIRCNNLEDLTDRDSFQWPSDGLHNNADACVYVAETDRVYVVFGGGQVAEVHPDTLVKTDVFAVTSTGNPSICSDGTNLYVLTSQTDSRILKYRISDFTLQGTATLTGRAGGHAILWDGEFIYAAGNSAPSWVARVNASDMTFTDGSLTSVVTPTDDLVSAGEFLYVGGENSNSQNLIRIEKGTLVQTMVPCDPSIIYGLHFDGRLLFVGHDATPGRISVFDPNTGYVGTFALPTGEDSPNEIHSLGDGRIIVTCWMSPSKVKRFTPGGGLPLPAVNRLSIDGVAVGTTGASEDTLKSVAVPGLTLGVAGGQAIRFTASGSFAANGNAKRLRLDFGLGAPTTFFDTGTLVFNDARWELTATCIGTAANAQKWTTRFTSDSALLATDVQPFLTTQADRSALQIRVKGTGVDDDDVKLESLILEAIT